MRNFVPILLLVICTAPLSACAQETTFQVDGVDFVRRAISVGDYQKEAVGGDLNGDGYADVVIAGNGRIAILQGNGDGHLEVRDRIRAGSNPAGPALADLDEDGHVDIAVANHETNYLTLLRGNGDGTFQPFPTSPLTVDVEPHPHAVRAADIDTDGNVDLIVDHRGGEALLILRGIGEGTFETPGTVVPAGGDPYRGMAVGDLNGDGQLDLVTPNPNGVGVMISTNAEQLAFSQDALTTEAGPFAVGLGDLSGDDQLDVIAALDERSPLVQVFLGDGTGTFREAADSPVPLAPGGKMVASGDFNGDGIDDAAITGWNASEVLLLLGGVRSIRTIRLPDAERSWGQAAADLNGDGADDLIIPDAANDQAVIYLSRNQ